MDRKDKIKKRLQQKLLAGDTRTHGEEKKEEKLLSEKTVPSLDNIKVFQAINEFISDITSIYGELDNMTELKAYDLLLSKTTLKHKKAIENHVNIFKIYCKMNEKFIIDKDEIKIENIKYNDKLSINIKYIFSIAERKMIKLLSGIIY